MINVYTERETGDAMTNHNKKMIAPIIVTCILVTYYGIYFGILVSLIDILVIKILLGVIPAIMSILIIYVCVQRIKEIRSGEEDDLSKY